MKINRAYLALVLVTLFWGITFPLIRISVQDRLTPSQFVFYRFSCAALLLAPFARLKLWKLGLKPNLDLFWKGFVLGMLGWGCFHTQTTALQTIEAGRAAFITGTAVILIPIMSPLFGLAVPSRIDFMAALGAVCGLYLITDPSGQGICTGDAWVALCALIYAFHVHSLQRWVKRESDTILLTFFQILGVVFCSVITTFITHPHPTQLLPKPTPELLIPVSICAFFSTVLATLLQTRYQPETSPQKAALIFSLESVFAAFFGYWILGEVLTLRGFLGCSLIFVSIVGTEILKDQLRQAKRRKTRPANAAGI